MKLAVIFFAVVCIRLKTCEATRCKKNCDKIFTVVTEKTTTADPLTDKNDVLKGQLLEAAVEETQDRLATLERQSKESELSPLDARLGQILRSNDRAREIGRAALTQLNFLRAFKELFDNRNRNATAAGPADSEDFFQSLARVIDGNILDIQTCSFRRQKRMAPPACPFPCLVCKKSRTKIRQFNGQCNNLGNPYYGSANIAQWRLLDASYYDGIEEFRRSASTGNPLPSARDVAQVLLPAGESRDMKASNFAMQVGQFLDHDVTHTPVRSNVRCPDDCSETDECKPIMTGPNTCMKFTRSELFLKVTCPPGPILPGNTITSWVDASQVYGSSRNEANKLVNFGTGYMIVTDNPRGPSLKKYLPHNTPEGDSECEKNTVPVRPCFLAGDVRQNEQSGLTAMHTVFMRLHNYIADQLKAARPNIQATSLFRRTRKLLIGFWQHIVYGEYLPSILGSSIMNQFELYPQTDGFFDGYDDSVKPDITVAFSTAAFRFGHTQIKKKMTFKNTNTNVNQNYVLSKIQFNPRRLYNSGVSGVSGVDAVIKGQLGVPDGARDNKFTDQVRNHLFTLDPPNGPGFDLPALNIQRGRDHGLPSYVYWREFATGNLPTAFNQLTNIMEGPNRFEDVYDDVEDIDLYAGGINEKKASDAAVGPTFGAIIGMQFRKLKFGDRFYYERDIGNMGFTEAQLDEVRKISLARILCDTLDDITDIQPKALYQSSVSGNGRVPCSDIDDVNYSVF